MTAALEGGEWSAARPGRNLPPGKTRYPFYRRLGGPQGRFGRAENLVPTGIRSRNLQPVVSRYTDRATRPTIYIYSLDLNIINIVRVYNEPKLEWIYLARDTDESCAHVNTEVNVLVQQMEKKIIDWH